MEQKITEISNVTNIEERIRDVVTPIINNAMTPLITETFNLINRMSVLYVPNGGAVAAGAASAAGVGKSEVRLFDKEFVYFLFNQKKVVVPEMNMADSSSIIEVLFRRTMDHLVCNDLFSRSGSFYYHPEAIMYDSQESRPSVTSQAIIEYIDNENFKFEDGDIKYVAFYVANAKTKTRLYMMADFNGRGTITVTYLQGLAAFNESCFNGLKGFIAEVVKRLWCSDEEKSRRFKITEEHIETEDDVTRDVCDDADVLTPEMLSDPEITFRHLSNLSYFCELSSNSPEDKYRTADDKENSKIHTYVRFNCHARLLRAVWKDEKKRKDALRFLTMYSAYRMYISNHNTSCLFKTISDYKSYLLRDGFSECYFVMTSICVL